MAVATLAAPTTLDDLNLRRDLVSSLVLRTLAFADRLSGHALSERIGLPFDTIQPLISEFEKSQLMNSPGFASEDGLEGLPIPERMAYEVSSAGRQRSAELSTVQTRYLGPCPVAFDDYLELVQAQDLEKASISGEKLKTALGNLELEESQVGSLRIAPPGERTATEPVG